MIKLSSSYLAFDTMSTAKKMKMSDDTTVGDCTVGQKRVCVVGGGPAGLVAIRRILSSRVLTGTLFEQKDDVGGVWYYNGTKEFATSSRNLRGSVGPVGDPEQVTTIGNTPGIFLELEDFPHPQREGHYPTQEDNFKYYRGYTTHFKLWPHIQLNTTVVSVRPETPITPTTFGEPGRWIVETHEHHKDIRKTEAYDAVIVCTGKNTHPWYGEIPGLKDFSGDVIHSKYFKNADRYQDKSVVIIGLGPSGLDQALILSKVASSVTVCNRLYKGGLLVMGVVPPGVRETTGVKLVTATGVVTEDKEVVPCDSLIISTGYGVKYPFLEPECQVEILDDKYITHLHNMTIYTKRPTLAITNLVGRAPEVLFTEAQVKYFVSYLEGKLKLPTFSQMEAMLTVEEDEKRTKGLPYCAWPFVGDLGGDWWKLLYKMMEECGLQQEHRHTLLLGQLFQQIFYRMFGKAALFKKDKLRIVNKDTMELILNHNPEYTQSKPGIVRLTLLEDGNVKLEEVTSQQGPDN